MKIFVSLCQGSLTSYSKDSFNSKYQGKIRQKRVQFEDYQTKQLDTY